MLAPAEHQHLADARVRRDPTRTWKLRAKMRAEGDRRWQLLAQTLRQALIEHDLIGLRGMSKLPYGDKTEGFGLWLAEELRQKVLGFDGSWLRSYVQEAANLAQRYAAEMTIPSAVVDPSRVAAMQSLAVSELKGIVAAAQQQITRAVAHCLATSATPHRCLASVAGVAKSMRNRTRAMAEYIVVKTHATATLSALRSAGVTHVGTVTERLQPRTRQTAHGRVLLDKRRPIEEGEDVDVVTAGDDDVCFPAWTMVRTDAGDQPIQSIVSGAHVLTRAGFRRVMHAVARQYLGKFSLVVGDHAAFVCTANHPVWCQRSGFTQACDLVAGDRLQFVDNELVDVRCIFDLGFSDVDNAPTGAFEKAVSFLARAFAPMPVGAVDFECDAQWQSKIYSVPTAFDFLLKWYAQVLESEANDSFKARFAAILSVASGGAKSSVSQRADSKFLFALSARSKLRRAAAFFRAVSIFRPISSLLNLTKCLAASFTDHVSSLNMVLLACPRTKVIAVGSGTFGDREKLLTADTSFCYWIGARSVVANARIEHSTFCWTPCAGRIGLKDRTTCLAWDSWCIDFCSIGACARAIAFGAAVFDRLCATFKRCAALITSEVERHGVTVYNLQVEGRPEYFANGILVHNCQVCEDISNEGPYELDEAEGLIPAHLGCRCGFVPLSDARFANVREFDTRWFDEDRARYAPGEISPHGGEFAPEGGAVYGDLVASRNVTSKKAAAQGGFAQPDVASMRLDPENYAHDVGLFSNAHGYPNFRAGELRGSPDERVQTITEHMKSNLKFIYDHTDSETRSSGMVWYDRTHDIAAADAKQFGLGIRSASAAYAAMSPQKDWNENIYLSHRIIEINATQKDFRWDDKMNEVADRIWALKPGASALRQRIVALMESEVKNARLGDLTDPAAKAIWIRTYDEAHSDRRYTEFDTGKLAMNQPVGKRPAEPSKAAWPSVDIIAGAVAAVDSKGDMKTISEALGERHKVRSFYNNIVDPHNAHGDVTIDTHAVGAALLRPLSGADTAVMHNLAIAPKANDKPPGWKAASSSVVTGIKGTYGIYADAYREAAKDIGIEPQQLQAIVWQAKRKMFDLSDEKLGRVEKEWVGYRRGKQDLAQTQNNVLNITREPWELR